MAYGYKVTQTPYRTQSCSMELAVDLTKHHVYRVFGLKLSRYLGLFQDEIPEKCVHRGICLQPPDHMKADELHWFDDLYSLVVDQRIRFALHHHFVYQQERQVE